MKTTLLIPTLNEIDSIGQILDKIDPQWVDQILFVDGRSTDGTLEFIKNTGYQYCIQKGKGLRNAYVDAYDHITGDILITFSPDGNSIPELIPELVKKVNEGYDMVIVSRYKDDAKSYDDDPVTAFGNWMFTHLINFLYAADYTDTMVMFRAYKKSIIKLLDLDKKKTYWPEKLFFTNISWEAILSARAAKKKLRISEIAGDEPARLGGKRKLQIVRWGFAYLTQILTDMIFWKKNNG